MKDLAAAIAEASRVALQIHLEAEERAVIAYFHGDEILARLSARLFPHRYVLVNDYRPTGSILRSDPEHDRFLFAAHVFFGTRDEARLAGLDVATEAETEAAYWAGQGCEDDDDS